MKKTIFSLMIAMALVSCDKQGKKEEQANSESTITIGKKDASNANNAEQPPKEDPNEPKAEIKFNDINFDFGQVNEGVKVRHVYKFKNTGTNPLIIKEAKASCGCTTPTVPKGPIAPGAEAEIVAEFDSKGRPGTANKTITVRSNTNPGETILTLKGEVKADATPQDGPRAK